MVFARIVLVQAALWVAGCDSSIIVKRKVGLTSDSITHKTGDCTEPVSCSKYKAVPVKDSTCACQCPDSMNTFSVKKKECIVNVPGCSMLVFDTAGQIFTFTLLDNKLYPMLPVSPLNEELDCNTENLAAKYETVSGWESLPLRTVILETKIETNKTYLVISDDKEIVGKLVKISFPCTDKEGNITELCLTFKMKGSQLVEVADLNTGQESDGTTTEGSTKLDVTKFYWIAGVCIGALVLAAALGLGIACATRSIGRRKEKKMRVLRLDENGNKEYDQVARKISRISTNPNGVGTTDQSNGEARKPIYKKNPNRPTQQGRQHEAVSPRSASNHTESPRRTPRPASQNSATFVVNENYTQTTHPLPTSEPPVAPSTKNSKSLKKKAKHLKREAKVINAAQTALTEFEGQRLPDVRGQPELFNPRYQRLAGTHASIKGMKGDSMMSHAQKHESAKQSKSKKSESKLSIDYKHFDMPSNEAGNDNSPPSPDHELLSTYSSDGSICKYDVDLSKEVPSERFYQPSNDVANNLNTSFGRVGDEDAMQELGDTTSFNSLTYAKGPVLHDQTLESLSPRNIRDTNDDTIESEDEISIYKAGVLNTGFDLQVHDKSDKDTSSSTDTDSTILMEAPITNIDDLIDETLPELHSMDSSFDTKNHYTEFEDDSYVMYTDTPL